VYTSPSTAWALVYVRPTPTPESCGAFDAEGDEAQGLGFAAYSSLATQALYADATTQSSRSLLHEEPRGRGSGTQQCVL
jgi:hypothetical protein